MKSTTSKNKFYVWDATVHSQDDEFNTSNNLDGNYKRSIHMSKNFVFNKPKWLIDEKIDLKRYLSGAWKVLNVEKRSIVNTYYEEWGSTSKPYCCQNIITKRNSERDSLIIMYFGSAVNSSSKICSLKWSTIHTLISSFPLSPIMETLWIIKCDWGA